MPKESILSKIKAYLVSLTEKRRERYNRKKQVKLTNTDMSVVGNNCVCGTIYSDLGLKYNTPTVNVLIDTESFFRFVEHLEYYISCDLEEKFLDDVTYPVGVLRRDDEEVILRFIHDKSFKSAKEKWVRRCARVDMDNIYIVFQAHFSRRHLFMSRSYKQYNRFKQLPYSKKRMLVNVLFSFDREVVPLRKCILFMEKPTIDYPTKFSKKRLMDDFDYVSFLNL